jgi:hypothetical protein
VVAGRVVLLAGGGSSQAGARENGSENAVAQMGCGRASDFGLSPLTSIGPPLADGS